MTHADIIAWWALVLAIFALIFHIPLSMLAHHYLPMVENYAAAHSRAKLVKRIAELQRRLDQLNDAKYFEDLEWRFREHLFVIMYMFGTGFFVQAGILFLATGAVPANPLWKPSVTLPLANRRLFAATRCFGKSDCQVA